MEFIILGAFIMIMIIFMGRSARKQQEKMLDAQAQAVQVGNDVVTRSGFLGRIVDIDGDAVTLVSPSGVETVWLKNSIMDVMPIPLAELTEEELAAEEDADEVIPAEEDIANSCGVDEKRSSDIKDSDSQK